MHAPSKTTRATLAPYLFPFSKEKLVIGRFCQIAEGVQFITAFANHDMDGISTYPFASFDRDVVMGQLKNKPAGSETRVGHDRWLGREALIQPGAELGHGVIVGARSVIAGKIPDYSIVAGNPARIVRMRYPAHEIERLLDLQWWNWPHDAIETAIPLLLRGDIEGLATLAPDPKGPQGHRI